MNFIKTLAAAFTILLSVTANALPLVWRADWPSARPCETLVHRGTDVELEPQWYINGQLANTTNWTFETYVQTNAQATGEWFGPLPGAAFSHTNDVGAAFYNVMVRAAMPGGEVNYTAFARLRMLDSPGYTPGALPLPVSTIDFSKVVALNAPWLLPAATNDIGTIKVELGSISNSVSTLSAATATNTAAIAGINSKIPSAASQSNQLADKEWIDDEIDTYAAYYITYDAAGAAFPTRAALTNATVVYSGGVARTPTRNDYCVVLADESHGGAEWRYIYAVADGAASGQWEAQYPIETNDYEALSNKPSINGHTLTNNLTGANLGVLDLAGGTLTGPVTIRKTGTDFVTLYLPGDDYWAKLFHDPYHGEYGWALLIGSSYETNSVFFLPERYGMNTFAMASDIPTVPNEWPYTAITNAPWLTHEVDPVWSADKANYPTVAEVNAALLLKANVSQIRYSFATATVPSGATTTVTGLDDRAINAVTLGADVTSATITLPAATPNRARDFFIDLAIQSTAPPTMVFVDPARGTSAAVKYGADSLADIAPGNNLVLFTEIAPTNFLVSVRHEEAQ